MKRITSKSGFTLVEIMIVVAIIALLAAIAIPNLLRAKITANDANAKATLKTLSTASEAFSAVNGAYPTSATVLTGATPPYLNSNPCATTSRTFVASSSVISISISFVKSSKLARYRAVKSGHASTFKTAAVSNSFAQ